MRVVLALLAIVLAGLPAAARTRRPDFAPAGTATVAAVIDGGTLKLADGSEVRLVGIEAPTAAMPDAADLAARAKAALATFVARGPVKLFYAGVPADRRGRVLAEVYAGGRWVQRELVRRGLARVHGEADARQGLTMLLAVEARARQRRRGLWRRPFFRVRRPDEAARATESFQIVAGTAVAAARVGGGVYVNFGPDWHTAFSLRFDRAAVALCRAAGLDPLALAGKRLRVRGFIDGVRRPVIDVTFPEQIEVIKARRPGPSSGPPAGSGPSPR